jgi:hypothetical protein
VVRERSFFPSCPRDVGQVAWCGHAPAERPHRTRRPLAER